MTDSERAAIRAQAFKEAVEIARADMTELEGLYASIRNVVANRIAEAIEARAKEKQP